MREVELQKAVLDVAAILGYRRHAERAAWSARGYRTPIQGDIGWPDVVLAGHGRFLVRELKVGRNVLSAEQAEWLRELRAAGIDAGVWTDSDWSSGLIEAELRRGTRHEREADAA